VSTAWYNGLLGVCWKQLGPRRSYLREREEFPGGHPDVHPYALRLPMRLLPWTGLPVWLRGVEQGCPAEKLTSLFRDPPLATTQRNSPRRRPLSAGEVVAVKE